MRKTLVLPIFLISARCQILRRSSVFIAGTRLKSKTYKQLNKRSSKRLKTCRKSIRRLRKLSHLAPLQTVVINTLRNRSVNTRNVSYKGRHQSLRIMRTNRTLILNFKSSLLTQTQEMTMKRNLLLLCPNKRNLSRKNLKKKKKSCQGTKNSS